jgi:transposase
MNKVTKPDKTRQLSIEQENAIEHLLQGKSDRAVAETVGVSRQTVWEWRNHDPLFIAELNRQRIELWSEARGRLKSLANRALDVVETQLDSDDPKAALAAAKYVLQGTKLPEEIDFHIEGPTTPEDVILENLRRDARIELAPKIDEVNNRRHRMLDLDLYGESEVEEEIESLAQKRLKKALAEAGLA